MRPLQSADLEFLLERRSGPCVSIYLPTARAGRETAENPIRFKNLLRQAENELAGEGEVLAPARALLDDEGLWAAPSDGLAVFVGGGVFGWFRVPLALPELVVVAERFHVGPLLRYFAADGRFYLLTLSHNAVRLFEATRTAIRELDLADTPRSLEAHRGPISDPDLLAGDETDKEELRRFLRQVDHGVLARLEDRQPPLVLAGVEYVQSIYREVSDYPNLVPEGLAGNLDEASAEELRERALPVVSPLFARGLELARARWERAPAHRRAVAVPAVVKAAADGAVETLFVADGPPLWGRWDESTREARETTSEDPGAEDLTDRAIAEVLTRRGQVFVGPKESLAGDGALTALLRF